MPDEKNFKEVAYATGGNATDVDSAIDCPVCHQRVKWARIYDEKNVGICGCPWIGWFADHRGNVYRWRPLAE